jgi:tripartite-type tricarboxylate transporter receptor subunit TctC
MVRMQSGFHKAVLRATSVAVLAVLGLATASAQAAVAAASDLKIIVGFAAGSGVDSIARVVADRVRATSSRVVIVENRPGGGGRIAAEAVVRAAPDGGTMLFAPIVTTAFTPFMFKNPGFDALTDLAPVMRLGTFKFTLALNAAVPARDVRDFVVYVKANPGKISYATPGPGTPAHFLGAMLNRATGTDLLHVPYRGSGPAAAALLAGEVQSAINTTVAMLPFYKSNQVKLLAVTGAKRAPTMPDVPTFGELNMNLGDMERAEMWYGFLAPGRTPTSAIHDLNAVLNAALEDAAVRDRLQDLDIQVATSSPEEFSELIKADYDRWGVVIRSTGFTLSE